MASITVVQHNPVTGVVIEPKTLSLTVPETGQLTATIEPDDASNKKVSWASDNDEIATVSDTGLVTAVAEGTIFITVTTEEGSFADKCEVTVAASRTPLSVSRMKDEKQAVTGNGQRATGGEQ